ncbi:hypothetical protein ACOME3_002946 [Neoechinorhynchus agilis]
MLGKIRFKRKKIETTISLSCGDARETFLNRYLAFPILHRSRMGDRYNIHSQLEHLQSKYMGTGHSDTTKWEWLTNIHRDSCASYIGHFDLLSMMAICENETKARVKFNLLKKMIQPCGPPPVKLDE